MVPCIGGHFGRPIRSHRGIWQGDIISPDLFDIVVDCVLREWHKLVGEDPTGIFYADDGRTADFDWRQLQRHTDILLDLFTRFGLHANATKTKAMVSLGCRPYGQLSDTAYKRRYDDTLPTYRARKLAKVECSLCHKNMTDQYLPTHMRDIHHVLPPREVAGTIVHEPVFSLLRPRKRPRIVPPPATDSSPACSDIVYRINVPSMTCPISCPVPHCPTTLHSRYNTQIHFCTRHPSVRLEYTTPGALFQCPHCGLFMSSLPANHHTSQFCQRYSRRRLLLDNERLQQDALMARFYVGDLEIEIVRLFQYLGRIICDDDSDDVAAYTQLKKARACWGRLGAILRSDGASPTTMGKFWKTILQAVLLYGSETWVISRRCLRRLIAFQARCARYMARRHIRQLPDGHWEHPPTAEVLADCKMHPLPTYINRRRHTLLTHYAMEHSASYAACKDLPTTPLRRQLWWNLDDY